MTQILLLLILLAPPFLLTGSLQASQTEAPARVVTESARDVPVAYDVDVVVVGGTSGGVAAAAEAAKRGANVFLAAQRPYLGEDICATYRLWLEPGEVPASPLAKKVFAEPLGSLLFRNPLKFTYEADRPSAPVHRDTEPLSKLTDGKWYSAASQSVQYDGDVSITADLGTERPVRNVHVMAYQRRNPGSDGDFEVSRVTVFLSNDKRKWEQATIIRNTRAGESLPEPWGAIVLSAPTTGNARYVKFSIEKSSHVNRVLLGEIVIEGEHSPAGPSEGVRTPPTPMQVKRVLDEALLNAGVQFLYGCYATDVLVDDQGRVAGIVMANRSGRQAVKARVVIDATPRAMVARMAGAAFKPYPGGLQTFRRIIVGGQEPDPKGAEVRRMPAPITAADGRGRQAFEYVLRIPMEDDSFASFARAEQIARDKTWNSDVADSSEEFFQVPPDPVESERNIAGSWPGADEVSLDVLRPKGIASLFVLGGCAGVSREAAERLLRPLELMSVGRRIGAAAAQEAKKIPKPLTVTLRDKAGRAVASGDTRESLRGLRPERRILGNVSAIARSVPVLGEYDVVVVGGGTGGAPAGIAAARRGAKTLVIEYLHGLGGVGTTGFISKYYYGYAKGFTREVDEGIAKAPKPGGGGWNIEWKKEWYRSELRKAGADIWFGCLGCGAFAEDRKVKGVVVATPEGRGVVLAKVVIDSTGNADVAAAAGTACVYTDGTSVAVQGAGLPPSRLGAGYRRRD
ncbi:MAG: FAD-dependent oxidoreductase [Sedimentisphaerales bacterium]